MEHLQKIKSKFLYEDDKAYIYTRLSIWDKSQTKEEAKTLVYSLYQRDEDIMLEYGVEKFYFILAGFLWQIENNVVDPELAYETYLDLQDFNTGEYDTLIDKNELATVKQDAKKAYDYIVENKLHE